jgi:hypothetical protein
MALDKALLGRLLQLNEPWTVRDFRFDPDARRLDAWIGVEAPRGWFGRMRRLARRRVRNACGDTSIWPAGAAMFTFRHRWVPI